MTAQQINLIDPALRVKRDWLAGRTIAGVAAALGLAVGAHGVLEQTRLSRLLASTSTAAPEPAASAEPSATETELREARREIARGERLLQAVAGLTDLPHDNARRLRNLIGAMPDTLWLQELEFSGERGVRIAGGATNVAALASFAQRLGAQPSFQGAPLHVFKVDPRAAPARPDAEAAAPADEHAAHYAFVLSTFDAEAAR